MTRTVNQNYERYIFFDEGQILFAPMQSKTAYLIDKDGVVNNTWTSSHTPGESVYMLDDGSIFFTTKLTFTVEGGAAGGVQRITWEGTKIWEFRYWTNDYLSHHDIEPLPNGNVLMIAWEYKTRNEAIAAGRDPNKLIGNILMPDHIIEVEPTDPTSGDIVWEWHVWDHLIQDFDPHKNNYGVVEDHPELIDINFGSISRDWLHTNSIDYNEEFDQILLSIPNFNEIWVIDHSTTTEEAAGHTGGNSGKGGDILYRWGNPRAYRAGTFSDQKFFRQHDARWIDQGYPGEGNILVFNNGGGRPGLDYTSIDEFEPPVDNYGNYDYTPGEAFGPEDQTWIYNASFYAFFVGGAQRIPSGNTLICNGPAGKFLEVTPEKEIVWEYTNPYPNPLQNNVFKVEFHPPEEPPPPKEPDLDCIGILNWVNVNGGATVYGSFEVKNIGDTYSKLDWEISEYPSWGEWIFTPESGVNLTPEDGPFTVQISVKAPNVANWEFEGYILIENQENPEDSDVIPVILKTPRNRVAKLPFLEYMKYHLNLFPILKLLLQRFG